MLLSLPDETAEEQTLRINKFLDENTVKGVCISCNEDIRGNEPMLETIHGPYHDEPRTCVLGRPGYE